MPITLPSLSPSRRCSTSGRPFDHVAADDRPSIPIHPREKRIIKTTALAVSIVFLLSPVSRAQKVQGSICVAPVLPPIMSAPGLDCQSGNLSFRLDAQKGVPWPHRESRKIEHLDLDQRHRVTVLCDGKPQQSFRFRFSEFRTKELCLFINDLYQTVQLWEPRLSPWCKCKVTQGHRPRIPHRS
jgi:hypothetical protein